VIQPLTDPAHEFLETVRKTAQDCDMPPYQLTLRRQGLDFLLDVYWQGCEYQKRFSSDTFGLMDGEQVLARIIMQLEKEYGFKYNTGEDEHLMYWWRK